MKIYIGIDNGVSGSIGIICGKPLSYFPMPIKKCLNYTKAKAFLNRVDTVSLYTTLLSYRHDSFCILERPMVNPMRWFASMSAIRALEATLIVLESLSIPYDFVDSRKWQKELLPSGLKGEELKLASKQVGMRMFPSLDWSKFKDADGLLIAEYARRLDK